MAIVGYTFSAASGLAILLPTIMQGKHMLSAIVVYLTLTPQPLTFALTKLACGLERIFNLCQIYSKS